MKKIILLSLILNSTLVFSQSKKEILTQKWKLNKVEEFNQQFSPMDYQKDDWLTFTGNGKFKGVIESNHVEGRWSANNGSVIISVNKQLSKAKINWTKVKTVKKGEFTLQYQNGDLITAILFFVPAK